MNWINFRKQKPECCGTYLVYMDSSLTTDKDRSWDASKWFDVAYWDGNEFECNGSYHISYWCEIDKSGLKIT